jgi:hypothetical protein
MIEPLCSFVKKNDMPQKRIKALISDSSLNAYGSRILTSGIDIEQYKRNPILLWMHSRADGGRKDEVLPLGHVEDLVIEGDALYGVPVFDAVDDFAKNVQALWESGTIKMVSGHFDIIELSADSQYMLPGQTRETVTKSRLWEVSIVDVGANDNALQMSRDGKLLCSKDGSNDLPLLKNTKPIINEYMPELKKIALALGLTEDASEEQCLGGIGTLKEQAGKSIALSKELEDVKLSGINAIVDKAVDEKRIATSKKDEYVSLGKDLGAERLQKIINDIRPEQDVKPSDIIGKSVQLGKTDGKKFSELNEAELIALRKDDPETYCKLYKEQYGIDCKIGKTE